MLIRSAAFFAWFLLGLNAEGKLWNNREVGSLPLLRATHSSGFVASTNSYFTNTAAAEISCDQVDAAGFLTNRTRLVNGQSNGVQTLYWGGRGRLWKVTERSK